MSTSLPAVGWIGLGAMGSGMASSLVSQGFKVKAYDVYPPSLEAVAKAGATPAKTPAEAATGIQVLGLMVVNAYQVDDVLFGSGRVAEVLEDGASIICFSTVPPSFLVTVKERLDALGKNIGLCDSPVSGGSTRAATGELAIMTSGTSSSVATARPVFDALTQAPVGALTVVGDKVGLASDFKLINQVFCAVQIASQGEAIALAKNMGLNPRLVYNLIQSASGHSFMFGHRVPWSLNHDGVPKSAMTIINKDIGIVMDEARQLNFPAPVCAVSEQLFTAAIGAGLIKEDDGLVSKLWERFGGQPVAEKGTVEEEEEKAKELEITSSGKAGKVLFVGLGAMGLPMAGSLLKAGVEVVGSDLSLEAMDRFSAQGGKVASDAVVAAKEVDTVVLVTVTALQAEAALFGADGSSGISSALPQGSTIILCSTVAPADAVKLQGLLDKQNKGLQLIDAPTSGGPKRSATGDLAIMASGTTEALSKASSVLQALSTQAGNAKNLHYIPGGVGNGSKVKAVNQLLACIHLAVAAEGFAFAKHKGMDLKTVFDVVSKGAASSYMMLDRVPRMFQREEAEIHSATTTLVKDLTIVLAEAKRCNTPLFLGQAALQQLTRACASGLGNEDDSSLGRLWEDMGVNLKL
ncbi:hypothetical protein CI109_106993 [Kwoniella shandongensis]|uniref:Uncharacterized protein n=1 Tax=Kwoniella shandongensis TaxID=1734106 RepID=A0A5M6C609_9TREE|nr:uncharacterized protein CI109_000755 [Kwoniella shandongensis]KAA5530577.1 hypothetical protein CI109_000755 [Kwoniella shandongensis]